MIWLVSEYHNKLGIHNEFSQILQKLSDFLYSSFNDAHCCLSVVTNFTNTNPNVATANGASTHSSRDLCCKYRHHEAGHAWDGEGSVLTEQFSEQRDRYLEIPPLTKKSKQNHQVIGEHRPYSWNHWLVLVRIQPFHNRRAFCLAIQIYSH
jgi:hypothetical protein